MEERIPSVDIASNGVREGSIDVLHMGNLPKEGMLDKLLGFIHHIIWIRELWKRPPLFLANLNRGVVNQMLLRSDPNKGECHHD